MDGEVFYGVKEAQVRLNGWRRYFNEERLHSSLGYQTPIEFAANEATRRAETEASAGTQTGVRPPPEKLGSWIYSGASGVVLDGFFPVGQAVFASLRTRNSIVCRCAALSTGTGTGLIQPDEDPVILNPRFTQARL